MLIFSYRQLTLNVFQTRFNIFVFLLKFVLNNYFNNYLIHLLSFLMFWVTHQNHKTRSMVSPFALLQMSYRWVPRKLPAESVDCYKSTENACRHLRRRRRRQRRQPRQRRRRIQYLAKRISMVYPSKSTRTDISGLAK